ncbi:hypothetical protein [Variovorax sp. KK3]|uniref:hypothetical protein n=1 Tax=Variovorax sp. KK3 TaxID=1855728 RepID=UPI00117F6786|nr:hypothetical protein [Variovorax sp. KK3]
MTQANFVDLFHRAVAEWPETVNLAEIQNRSGDHHSIRGLWTLLEEIEDPHIGSKEEVVVRELHWSIYTVIHMLAKSMLELKPSSIRPEAVEHIFRRRLQTAVDLKDPRWSVEDFALAQAYLEHTN